MDKNELKKFVEENPSLVSMKPAGEGMFVLKYKKSVFFRDLWNEYLEECRGTIIDADFNVIQRPFSKIYNLDIEKKAPVLADDTKITAYRKVNGFMVAISVHNGELIVSTTGSTDSKYVAMARELIDVGRYTNHMIAFQNMTFMFECCHRNDPHIIPEEEGMYLLGYRAKEWDSKVYHSKQVLDDIADLLKCHKVESLVTTVGELRKLSKTVRHEGFVAYTEDGGSFKIKSPYYLVKKWVARNPNTDKLMNDAFKEKIDEEYYPLVDAIRANIVEYTTMDEQARLAWVRNFLEVE